MTSIRTPSSPRSTRSRWTRWPRIAAWSTRSRGCPGASWFTNGDAPYARRVLARLGLGDSFEAIHDIHACAYRPKPAPESYRSMVAALGVRPATALFVEDMARNLRPAKALGMTTVWVNNGSEQGEAAHADFVDYEIADVGAWLHDILAHE